MADKDKDNITLAEELLQINEENQEKILEEITKLTGEIKTMKEDIAFIKNKTDQISLKLYWVNKLLDEQKK